MNCSHAERYLDALMDGELDPNARSSIDKHLSDCASCSEQLSYARSVRGRLRASVAQNSGGSAPDSLRARVVQAFEEERGTVWWRVDTSWRATATAAALALAVFGIGAALHPGNNGGMQAGIVPIFDDVMRVHTRGVPSEVHAQEQVPAYFEDRLGFRVRPVDFRVPGVRFIGARDTQVGGRQAATLQYEVRGRRMTVVAFRPPAHTSALGEPFGTHGGRMVRAVLVHGQLVPLVERDGVVYAVVSDLDADDGLELASHASLH